MRKKIEQDLFKKRIEKEISIVKEMISEFDVIKKRVIELNEQARYDPLAASTLNKIIEAIPGVKKHAYTIQRSRKLMRSQTY